uniref:NADH-ubiquinone oxidoreductase chain 2 n=1 Tax=Fomitopsis palustris TaxID=2870670 RepID=A0A1V1G908_9APHY|nr:NADH dehydrogenase subunit 2 [Fomitopsis palustris]BAX08586.1 NADH dehydrogenase subunit 2 [Fomitopsis palustris]
MIFLSLLILIVAVALPSINKNINSILYIRISSIIFIYSGALSLNALYIQSIGSGIGIYSGLFHVTTISQLLDIIIFTIGSLILISWPKFNTEIENDLNKKTNYRKHNSYNYICEYSLIVLFSTFGASLLVSSADLISVYLSIELQSFAVYILSTLYRDSESSTSAGLKYFLLGGLSSCLILLGCGLIYSFTGLTNLESIYSFVSVSDSNNIIQAISLGILFIFLGFLFKIAAAPLHNWAPDVYDDTPTIVTIWLTIMPKISIIIFLLELHTQLGIIGNNLNIELVGVNLISNLFTENIQNVLKNLLLITSLISLIIGTIVGLAQSRIKRLLAYSTISHIGFMLLALAINTEQSIDSLIFYIIQYSITNLNTFLIILGFGYIINNSSLTKYYGIQETRKDIKFISELKGQFFANPLLSIALTICLFSMAGVPPLIGFFSKQFVLYSAIQSGYYFMSIVAIVVSVISASYYLKIIRVLHSENDTKIFNYNININSSEFTQDLTNYHSYLISTLTLSILLFVLKPSILLNSTQLLSLSLFNF